MWGKFFRGHKTRELIWFTFKPHKFYIIIDINKQINKQTNKQTNKTYPGEVQPAPPLLMVHLVHYRPQGVGLPSDPTHTGPWRRAPAWRPRAAAGRTPWHAETLYRDMFRVKGDRDIQGKGVNDSYFSAMSRLISPFMALRVASSSLRSLAFLDLTTPTSCWRSWTCIWYCVLS